MLNETSNIVHMGTVESKVKKKTKQIKITSQNSQNYR